MTSFASSDDALETLWRIELLHPAAAHFPIVLALLGTVFWLTGGLRGRWAQLDAFALCGVVVLLTAAVSAWLATQSGFWADAQVGRELYDPRPLKEHENYALAVSWLVSGCGAGAAFWRWAPLPSAARRALWWLVALAGLVACGLMAYVAHLGAGLVYQQGAGVVMPQ